MPENDIEDLDQLDGSALRKKYESALKELKTLRPEVAKAKASEVIRTKGFTLVKPEDLEGVDPDKVEEKAASLQQERRDLQVELARDLLAKQGLEGSELDEAVEEFKAGSFPVIRSEGDEAARQLESVRALDRLDSTPTSASDPSKLHGRDAIEHGLSKPKTRRF